MPAVIKMRILNGNPTAYQMPVNNTTVSSVNVASSSLKSSMIGRIHNIKPGCGGCGRH